MRPRAIADLVKSELDGGEVAVSTSNGARAVILNAVADAVLELCNGAMTSTEIAEVVRDAMNVPASIDVMGDVERVLRELVAAGIVESVE